MTEMNIGNHPELKSLFIFLTIKHILQEKYATFLQPLSMFTRFSFESVNIYILYWVLSRVAQNSLLTQQSSAHHLMVILTVAQS